ncbi:MAG: radical SAM protein, partial [Arthrobacter sp.]
MRLYIHWPFCASRCAYCDFNSRVAAEGLREHYQLALLEEARRWGARLGEGRRELDSIYIGGGTPSLLSGAGVAGLLDQLEYFTMSPAAEITVEVNPADWSSRDFTDA